MLGAGAVYIRVVMVAAHSVQSGVQQATQGLLFVGYKGHMGGSSGSAAAAACC